MIVFLLYFCNEASAYKILHILHQEIIPTRFQYYKIKEEDEIIEGEVALILSIVVEKAPTIFDLD